MGRWIDWQDAARNLIRFEVHKFDMSHDTYTCECDKCGLIRSRHAEVLEQFRDTVPTMGGLLDACKAKTELPQNHGQAIRHE